MRKFLLTLGMVVALTACTVKVESEPATAPTASATAKPTETVSPEAKGYVDFVQYVRDESPSLVDAEPVDLIKAGEAVCTGLSGGLTLEQTIETLMDAGLVEGEIVPLVAGSVKYICPENTSKMQDQTTV